jgi:hypothetical protein
MKTTKTKPDRNPNRSSLSGISLHLNVIDTEENSQPSPSNSTTWGKGVRRGIRLGWSWSPMANGSPCFSGVRRATASGTATNRSAGRTSSGRPGKNWWFRTVGLFYLPSRGNIQTLLRASWEWRFASCRPCGTGPSDTNPWLLKLLRTSKRAKARASKRPDGSRWGKQMGIPGMRMRRY